MQRVLWVGLLIVAAACGTKDSAVQTTPPDNTPPPTDDAGGGVGTDDAAGTDDATGSDEVAPDTGEGPACGKISCHVGEYCCDGDCGSCAAVGTNCPAVPCPDATPPPAEDAQPPGD